MMVDMATRRGDWQQVYTGRAFWPLDPRPEEIDIHDIAHALSMQCRYGGHCRRFYSVAEHSIHLSHVVPLCDALWGLLHDASEAYLVDIPRPLKRSMEDYRRWEGILMQVVAERFGLPLPMPDSVALADVRILTNERQQNMVPMRVGQLAWGNTGAEIPKLVLRYLSPGVAERRFLARFAELTDALHG